MNDILALVGDIRAWGANVKYAANVAAMLECALTGAYILPPCPPSYDFAPPSLASEIIEICRGQFDVAVRAGKDFSAWAAGNDVPSNSWHIAEGSPIDVIASAANWHDLAVLERGESFSWIEAGQALLAVDIPCLVVPEQFEEFRLDTIAVAWNGSAQSARAVHSSLPLLRRASMVVLIDGSHIEPLAGTGVGAGPARNIELYLAGHDIKVTRTRIDADAAHAGEQILDAASDGAADLLVMGAYGRARFSEWIFGGATRHVLEHARLPLFMRH
ncbi:MAG TPA: universal stress protein [Rudaea sp.]|nr:universal stress protein [Rudaea sp.]